MMEPWMFRSGGMWIFPLIGIAVFLLVIRFVFTSGFGGSGPFCEWSGRGGGNTGQRSPLDVLKFRYARGEVSREEFERMKKDLSEG